MSIAAAAGPGAGGQKQRQPDSGFTPFLADPVVEDPPTVGTGADRGRDVSAATDLPYINIDQDGTLRIVAACGHFYREGDAVTLVLKQHQVEVVGDFLRLTEALWKP